MNRRNASCELLACTLVLRRVWRAIGETLSRAKVIFGLSAYDTGSQSHGRRRGVIAVKTADRSLNTFALA